MPNFDKLTKADALDLVAQLAALKHFPPQPTWSHIADQLINWCGGTLTVSPKDQAKWFIQVALEWDEYPGPLALHKLIEDKYYPAGGAAIHKPLKRESRVECPMCNGWWTLQDQNGRFIWCTCSDAAETRRQMPDWVAFVNRFPAMRIPNSKTASRFLGIKRR